jgi:formylglycine-generating enzyme required for sulfatase activity
MPSEQARGRPKFASDVYAVGMMGIQSVTGYFPHQLQEDPETGEIIWKEYAQISDELGEVLDKMVRDHFSQRYQTASAALQALMPIIEPQSPPTLQPTIPVTLPPAATQPIPSVPTVKISTPPPQPSPTIPSPPVIATPQLQQFEFEVVTLKQVASIKVIEERGFWGQKTTRETPEISLEAQTSRHRANFFREELGNGVTLDMVEIPGGRFTMGSPASETESSNDERPQHQVTIQSFYMGKFEVTQAQYGAIMRTNTSGFKGANRPVENVSWNDAVEFCKRLSKKTGRTYRLPSEAEWEYACRAGTTTPFYFGETITADLVNCNGNFTYGSAPKGKYRQQTADVGSLPPNAWGLYDMHGNVWEWCADSWHSSYRGAPTDGSAWIDNDNRYRVLRGGSWDSNPSFCRSAVRYDISRDVFSYVIGFRVVCVFGRT